MSSFPTGPIKVLAIAPGSAIGPVRLYVTVPKAINKDRISSDQVEAELQRLSEALAAAIDELRHVSERVARTVGQNEADIFAAQQLMLEDPELLEEIQT